MYLLGAPWLNELLRKQILFFFKFVLTMTKYHQIIKINIFFFCPHCHFVQICGSPCSHWCLAHCFSVIRKTETNFKDKHFLLILILWEKMLKIIQWIDNDLIINAIQSKQHNNSWSTVWELSPNRTNLRLVAPLGIKIPCYSGTAACQCCGYKTLNWVSNSSLR